VTTEARNRLNIRVYGRCSEMEWQRAQRRHFREKRKEEARAWAVQMFKAAALVFTAFAAFCAANFGSGK